jgi:hypothetical protein
MKLSRILMGWTDRESGPESAPLRRSTRLLLAIDVILSGQDEDGQPFREETRTVEVSRYGAKIGTQHRLELGARVLIENCALARTATAKVVWKGNGSSSQNPLLIGVELLELFEPERIWGVESPPRDWQEDSPRPTLAQELEYVAAREWASVTEFADPSKQIPSPAPEVAAADHAAKTTSSIGKGRAIAVLEDPGGVIDATASPAQQSSAIAMAEITAPLAQKLQELVETARRSTDEAVRCIDVAAEAAVARLQALEKKIETSFQATAGDSQKTLAALSASSTEALQHRAYALLEDLRQQQGQLRSTLSGLEEKGAKQRTTQLQNFSGELEASLQVSLSSLTKATEESRGELAEAARRSADEAARSINAAAESAVASLQTLRESTEASLADLAEKVRRQLAEPALDTERLQRKADDLFKDFEGQLQNTLDDLERKGEQLSAQLQKVTEDLVERSAKEFQKQASDTAKALGDRVRAWEAGLANQALPQLEASLQVSLSAT